MLTLSTAIIVLNFTKAVEGQPTWPSESSWNQIEPEGYPDANESSSSDDYKDVKYSYYYIDEDYLYFRLECYGYPNLTAHPDARYKWFIDITNPHNLVGSGNTLIGAEYLLFVEDSPKPHGDGTTDVYLLYSENGVFPTGYDYYTNPGNITNTNIANCSIHGHFVDLYILLENIGNPNQIYFTWAVDQADPNVGSSNGEISELFFNPSISKSDMGIVKSDDPDPVYAGDYLTYTLNVTNWGPHAAAYVNVTDVLPDEVTFISADSEFDGNSGSTYWWTYSNFGVGESEIITITVNVSSSASGIINNTASVSCSNLDFVQSNNEDSEDTTIDNMVSLTINIVGNGSVTKDPDQTTYLIGSIVDLNASADLGWSFVGWSGDLVSSSNPGSIIMDGDKTVNATFTEDCYTLTVNVVGDGSVTKNPVSSCYTYGTVVELNASADLGWSFVGWSGDLVSSSNPGSIIMDGDKNVTAYFTQDHYILNITIVGLGSVSKIPDQINYTYGTNVELTAYPGTRYKFYNWSGDITGTIKTEIINMTGDKFITATFKASGGGGGGIPPDEDEPPTAIISGPYFGTPNEEIQFDATESHDNDENGQSIVRFDWKFSDDQEWQEDLGATPIYLYTQPGVYTVTLKVFDDEGSYDTNTTTVTIIQPNIPPSIPEINGPNNGIVNISYNYTVVSTDEDGDDLIYLIDWGDGTLDESELLSSGEPYSISHKWAAADNYIISVTADDGSTVSANDTTIKIIEPPKLKQKGFDYLLLLLLLLLFLVLLLIILAKRRKDKEEEQKPKGKPKSN